MPMQSSREKKKKKDYQHSRQSTRFKKQSTWQKGIIIELGKRNKQSLVPLPAAPSSLFVRFHARKTARV